MSENFDELAAGLLLDGSIQELRELSNQAEVFCSLQCPSCGGRNIEDNGESPGSTFLSIYCHDCDQTFDPNSDY